MITGITTAISKALDAEFGEEYTIYTEQKKQGLKEPCFFISCINSSDNLFLGKKYFGVNLFCIQYFPKSENSNAECHDVAGRMRNCLEYINSEGLIRGEKMNHEIVDGVLSFFVHYDMFTYKTEEKTAMNKHSLNNYTKG